MHTNSLLQNPLDLRPLREADRAFIESLYNSTYNHPHLVDAFPGNAKAKIN